MNAEDTIRSIRDQLRKAYPDHNVSVSFAATGYPDTLTAYERGYLQGLRACVWWKEGMEYVGPCGTTYDEAAERIEELDKRNKELEAVLRWTLGSIDEDHPAKKVLRIALVREKKDV